VTDFTLPDGLPDAPGLAFRRIKDDRIWRKPFTPA